MAEIIYGTPIKLVVGKSYHGLSDHTQGWHAQQPFVVLREATFQEWVAFAEDEGIEISANIMHAAQRSNARFYGISTD